MTSSHVLPVVGNDGVSSVDEGNICLSLEVYKVLGENGESFIIVQQRSRCLRGHERAFAHEVLEWSRCIGAERVVILGGADGKDRLDTQMSENAGAVEFLSNSPVLSSTFASLGFKEVLSLEERNSKIATKEERDGLPTHHALSETVEDSSLFMRRSITLRSGGITRAYCEAAEEFKIPCIALVIFMTLFFFGFLSSHMIPSESSVVDYVCE